MKREDFKDEDVFLQQYALKQLGFDPGKLDGIEGKDTRAAKTRWLQSLDVIPSGSYLFQSERYYSALIRPEKEVLISTIVSRIISNRSRYEAIEESTGVPWYAVAGLHNMESSGNFSRHLHEGSPLTGRTKYIPKGRPTKGDPPFTWEESAIDALIYDNLHTVMWDSLNEALQAMERYNGLGYQKHHPETPSPYLWAGTTIEKPGKYVADGKWDSNARSAQIGVAAIWKELEVRGIINL